MSKRIPTFPVDETTFVFAFRYALDRHTGATTHMVTELRKHWPRLSDWTQRGIHNDIKVAYGCEMETWREVLRWPVKLPVKKRARKSKAIGYVGTDGNAHDDGEACDCT